MRSLSASLTALLLFLLLVSLPGLAGPKDEVPLYPGLKWSSAVRRTSPLDGKTRVWVRTTARTPELTSQGAKVMAFYTDYLESHGWTGAPVGRADNWVMEMARGDKTVRIWMWTSATGASDSPADPKGPMLGLEWGL